MSQPQNNDGLFILAALYAQQAYADAQYNNKLNAYVSRGYTINDANQIVRTWYLAHAPRRWNVDAWRLTYIAWISLIVYCYVTNDYSDVPSMPVAHVLGAVAFQVIAITGVTVALRRRIAYCLTANERSLIASEKAKAWLASNRL